MVDFITRVRAQQQPLMQGLLDQWCAPVKGTVLHEACTNVPAEGLDTQSSGSPNATWTNFRNGAGHEFSAVCEPSTKGIRCTLFVMQQVKTGPAKPEGFWASLGEGLMGLLNPSGCVDDGGEFVSTAVDGGVTVDARDATDSTTPADTTGADALADAQPGDTTPGDVPLADAPPPDVAPETSGPDIVPPDVAPDTTGPDTAGDVAGDIGEVLGDAADAIGDAVADVVDALVPDADDADTADTADAAGDAGDADAADADAAPDFGSGDSVVVPEGPGWVVPAGKAFCTSSDFNNYTAEAPDFVTMCTYLHTVTVDAQVNPTETIFSPELFWNPTNSPIDVTFAALQPTQMDTNGTTLPAYTGALLTFEFEGATFQDTGEYYWSALDDVGNTVTILYHAADVFYNTAEWMEVFYEPNTGSYIDFAYPCFYPNPTAPEGLEACPEVSQ